MSTKLVSILNITPDSFSDGGELQSDADILDKTKQLIEQGSDIIDIGAESTRPDAQTLGYAAEWQRLENILPRIIKIAREHNILTALDTRYPENAVKAISLGVDWINDVSGFSNRDMIDAVKAHDNDIVVMHSLTVPADKNIYIDESLDIIAEIRKWAIAKINNLTASGIDKNRIILDPGLGFGKTAKQSWEIINRVAELKDLGCRLYIGHSRKSFIGGDIADRDKKTLAISEELVKKGIDFIRVHNIAMHSKFIKGEN